MFQEQLLKELKKKFEETKKELSFKSSFNDINDIFFINDFILHEKFVSEFFDKQLSRRIVETYNSWVSYLHNLIMPNPSNSLMIMESRMINDEDKKKISDIIKKILHLTSAYTLIMFTQNKKDGGKFIDDSVEFWKKKFQPEMKKIMEKINKGWKEAEK